MDRWKKTKIEISTKDSFQKSKYMYDMLVIVE